MNGKEEEEEEKRAVGFMFIMVSSFGLTSYDGLDADVRGGEGARGRGGRRLGALLSSASALLGTWGIEGSS